MDHGASAVGDRKDLEDGRAGGRGCALKGPPDVPGAAGDGERRARPVAGLLDFGDEDRGRAHSRRRRRGRGAWHRRQWSCSSTILPQWSWWHRRPSSWWLPPAAGVAPAVVVVEETRGRWQFVVRLNSRWFPRPVRCCR